MSREQFVRSFMRSKWVFQGHNKHNINKKKKKKTPLKKEAIVKGEKSQHLTST